MNNITLSQLKATLHKDFLERDADFIYQRSSGRLGWEQQLRRGSAYSIALCPTISDDNLLKKSYRLATRMISAMNTPYKVKVLVSPGESSYTDSKVVHVSTKVLDDTSMDLHHRVDIFLGTTVHEGCHLLYTDFTGVIKDRLTHSITNVLEDERIERLCGEETPGLANFLRCSKYYFFNRFRITHKDELESYDDFSRMINAIIVLVRYPSMLSDKEISDFGPILLEVRDVLTPFPSSTKEAKETATKIVEIIKRYFKENTKDTQQGGDGTDSEQNEGDDKGESSQEQSSGTSGGEENKKGSEDEQTRENPDKDNTEDSSTSESKSDESEQPSKDEGTDTQENGDNETKGDQSAQPQTSEDGEDEEDGAGSTSMQFDDMSEEEMQAAMDKIAEVIDDMVHNGTANDIDNQECDLPQNEQCQALQKNNVLAEIIHGNMEVGISDDKTIVSKVVISNIPETRSSYEDSLHRVKKYVPAIKRILQSNASEYQYKIKGTREGRLDSDKLAEAFQGSQNVYERKGEVKSNRMSVCILIDESGSMYGDKCRSARDTAILLNEALSGVPNVDLYIYGHTTATGSRCILYPYREGGRIVHKYALGMIDAINGNYDSLAIKEAGSRVRQNTQDKCLMFVITDGAPNEGPELVRKTVQKMESDRFDIIAISIEPDYDPGKMYDKHLNMDLEKLPMQLGKLIRKSIVNNTSSKDW